MSNAGEEHDPDTSKRERFERILLQRAERQRSLVSGLRPARDGSAGRLRLAPADRARPLPLAHAQERFWFLHQLDPASPADNVAVALRIEGPLDTSIYQQAWDTILMRHEILRTTFPAEHGEPAQMVGVPGPATITQQDFRHLPVAGRRAAALAAATADADCPFDLERGPVYRLVLYRLDEHEYIALSVFHHIVCDLWSLGVLSHELSACYTAIATGSAAALPPLPFQYADYAVSHRSWLSGSAVDTQLAYWRVQLAAAQSAELTTDRPRAGKSGAGATGVIDLPPDLLPSIRAYAGRESVTPFMVLIAAFAYLHAQYTGDPDVILGLPIANRPRLELKAMVGTFVNTIVFRIDVSGVQTFAELLERARRVSLEAFNHQDVSFHRLVSALRPDRAAGRSAFFQTLFNVQNAPVKMPQIPGLTISPVTMPRQATQFDLGVWVDTNVLHQVGFSYDTSLFDADTVQRLVAHYIVLLQTVVAAPDRPLSEIDLLLPSERQLMLSEWNDTRSPRADDTVVGVFQQQARLSPNAIAVEGAGRRLSYGDLDTQSTALAHVLRRRGVVGESVVGICLPRGVDMVVALLGALKAGAAYLPLDPAYPRERLAYMVRDAQAPLVLTDPSTSSLFPEAATLPVPSGPVPRVERDQLDEALPALEADDLAYVIYTSGSTGRPKGVEVSHRSLANFLHSMRARPGMSPTDRLLAVTTLSFDIAGLEFYLPLICGATVVIADREASLDPATLARLLDDARISVMQATPTTWRMLVDSEWRGRPELCILCGGETLPRDLAERLLTRGREVWNLYGPTETTIWSTAERVASGTGPVSIGRPIANTQVYVLDPRGRPAPIGVGGELYIGGLGVARGYLGQPDLTATRFVPDPFDSTVGTRLYRTGDRARFLRDGRLELLGRADDQVKIRGFRVEIGEVEAALRATPGVKEGVVAMRPDAAGGMQLVAFIVADDVVPVSAKATRDDMAKALPHFMIPTRIVALAALPTTPNGKIDRAALPALTADARPFDDRDVLSGDTEQRLATLWMGILGVEHVAANEDFFDLGGHSLLAVRLVSLIELEFGRVLSVNTVLTARTVRQLARQIDESPKARRRRFFS